MSLLTALHESADDEAAVTVSGDRLSRHDLLRRAADVAADVAGMPMVAVDATASVQTVVAVTGALLAGVPVVPVPPDAGTRERDHVLRDSGSVVILSDDPRAAGDSGVPVVPLTQSRSSAACPAEPDMGAPAIVLYTSGTTGPPKGVVLSRAAVAANLDALAEAWQWSAADTLVHGLPLHHVHGLILGVLGALRTGSRLVHTGRPTPQAYAAAGGTLYFGVPTIWARICAAPDTARQLRSARLLVSGSAPLPRPVFHDLAQLTGQAPVERYGMTETLITISTRADGDRRPGHVGLPLPDVRTRIVDDLGHVIPADSTIGRLQVQGPTLLDGYLRGGAVQPADLVDGWFDTGDVAAVEPDGWHRIVGRASTDLIKTGGYRVGAGEVEDALLLHPAVHEAAVVGMPHPDLGEQVTAYVVADAVRPDELIAFVAEQLATHKRPRRVHMVKELPRNAMGKVQKTLLRSGE